MTKEIYKLILVFIMISFSFSLAFFLGRESALKGQSLGKNSRSPVEELGSLKPSLNTREGSKRPFVQGGLPAQEGRPAKAAPDVIESAAKPTELKPSEGQKNAPQGSPLAGEGGQASAGVSPPLVRVFYSLFIADYSNKEQAMKKAAELKLSFPGWRVFFKKSRKGKNKHKTYTVYIGPFQTKETAQDFLMSLHEKQEFASARIKKMVVKKLSLKE